MKKIIATLGCFILVLAFSMPVYSADVEITITIPDAHVTRVAAAVNSLGASLCGVQLTPKQCLKKYLIVKIKELVKSYEASLSSQTFTDAFEDIEVE